MSEKTLSDKLPISPTSASVDLPLLAIIIPAYEPDEALLSLMDDLRQEFSHFDQDRQHPFFVIINDGSIQLSSRRVFDQMAEFSDTQLLHHEDNKGKGAALKTGISYAQKNGYLFVVTADADGQHLARDIRRVSEHVITSGNFTLGVRAFSEDVPLRSRFGNIMTARLFSLAFRTPIRDTQTGLRAFPARHFGDMAAIASNRYEYEFQALINAVGNGVVDQVDVETVYEPGNISSHYRPLLDSGMIYLVFLRYIFLVPLIGIADISAFTLLSDYLEPTTAFGIVRMISVIVYFVVMRRWVFRSEGPFASQIPRYLLLVFFNIAMMLMVFNLLEKSFPNSLSTVYLVSSLVFFVFNFMVQRCVIFKS